jgi:predicted cupin superfamily sugar epimerase
VCPHGESAVARLPIITDKEMLTADELIAALELQPLPLEGGYFRETYRSPDRLAAASLPDHYRTDKALSTAIYYLLTPQTFSALHRLPTDEIFHFYLGSPVQMLQLRTDGQGQVMMLGPDVLGGQSLQIVVPRGVWQGSWLMPGGSYALLGTTMAPGFDFADYEAASAEHLIEAYPDYAELIHRLTR